LLLDDCTKVWENLKGRSVALKWRPYKCPPAMAVSGCGCIHGFSRQWPCKCPPNKRKKAAHTAANRPLPCFHFRSMVVPIRPANTPVDTTSQPDSSTTCDRAKPAQITSELKFQPSNSRCALIMEGSNSLSALQSRPASIE
jgi:hypothetical protein